MHKTWETSVLLIQIALKRKIHCLNVQARLRNLLKVACKKGHITPEASDESRSSIKFFFNFGRYFRQVTCTELYTCVMRDSSEKLDAEKQKKRKRHFLLRKVVKLDV